MTGRPAWTPSDTACQEAREMASNELTVSQAAECLGILGLTLGAGSLQISHSISVY